MSHFCTRQPPYRSPAHSNGRRTVGDGATYFDNSEPSVLAVCHLQDNNDIYYYSTTYSGGPGVRPLSISPASLHGSDHPAVAFLTPLESNALQTEGRRTV